MESHAAEVAQGQRFEFGKNWTWFLATLTDAKIEQAVQSLQDMLEVADLKGARFLDIGSGSGLFSLAARRLGARVHSLDYDPHSVACTRELRRRYFPEDPEWIVESGSALDEAYIRSLGEFDVVYSWGVLHHTGQMWAALANAAIPVADGGKLFIAIYNDQGTPSRRWTKVKRTYNALPKPLRFLVVWPSFWTLYWRPLDQGFPALATISNHSQLRQGARYVVMARSDRLGGRLPFRSREARRDLRFLSRSRPHVNSPAHLRRHIGMQ